MSPPTLKLSPPPSGKPSTRRLIVSGPPLQPLRENNPMAEKANTKPSSPPSSPEMLQGMAAALSKSGDPQIGGTSRFVRQKSPPRSKDGSGNAKIKGGISVL